MYIKRGATGKPLRAQLRDRAGPVDLTGATVTFRMWPRNSTVLKVEAVATTEAPVTDGWVHYAWAEADVDTAGTYEYEFRAVWPSGDDLYFPTPDHGILTVVNHP